MHGDRCAALGCPSAERLSIAVQGQASQRRLNRVQGAQSIRRVNVEGRGRAVQETQHDLWVSSKDRRTRARRLRNTRRTGADSIHTRR